MCEPSTTFERSKEILLARLKDLLDQSGEPSQSVDLEAWLDDWVRKPLPELGGSTPAKVMTCSRGLNELVTLLERMRGGLAA